ncbi:acyl carrier protein [Utexia brackfieldae]|uniref:acyl carrier protein n=1 Tax=Utexia brackfieldae TaxID=3074108 RepID=UPI00370D2974
MNTLTTDVIESLIKEQVDELTDFDVTTITQETPVSEFGFVSLDFISIQVALKRASGVTVDLSQLAEANVTTFGELIAFLSQAINQKILNNNGGY